MKEEIEAAAEFITKLVNKNLSSSNACSSASSTHSFSSSSSSSSSSSESPPAFDEPIKFIGDNNKVDQFRQCLRNALYERFHNHWFPEQPTKGQAYRCIRLNEWDRHDITLQKACTQCGVDYKDLQLPVELTLWVDPDEVTCRFGENKGSHCLVAKFKDGDDFNLDINNIDIEIFRQTTRPLKTGSPDQNKQHNQHSLNNNNIHYNNNNNSNHHNSSYPFLYQNNSHHNNHQQPQQQSPLHQQHRSSYGKTPILPSYHHNYSSGCDSSGNPIYYYLE